MRKLFDKARIVLIIYFFACLLFVFKFSTVFEDLFYPVEDSEPPIILQIHHKRYHLSPQQGGKVAKINSSALPVIHAVKSTTKLVANNTSSTWNSQTSGNNNNNYDSKVKSERRLGFGVDPLQKLPRSWMDTLDRKYPLDSQSVKLERKPIKILLYDSFDWWKFDAATFGCPRDSEFKCEFKEREAEEDELEQLNKERASQNQSTADTRKLPDAILIVHDFHHRIEAVKSYLEQLDQEQEQRNPGKIIQRIYFTLESPFASQFPVRLSPRRDFLASYWRGSDIYAPYFKWIYTPGSSDSSSIPVSTQAQTVDYAMGKTKMAAIVVSNCAAQNGRMEMVKELQKYIQVDIYGSCGELDCTLTNCFQEIKNSYKFYLAFENSNCRDYITEKIYHNAFENNLIPVVYGAHPLDYKAIAPHNSYIHVEDFESIKELAEYMELLNSNDTLYNEFFLWKSIGQFQPNNFLCQVCAFLHLENENTVVNPDNVERVGVDVAAENGNSNMALDDGLNESYLNRRDSYKTKTFEWTDKNELMCLERGKWFWNKG